MPRRSPARRLQRGQRRCWRGPWWPQRPPRGWIPRKPLAMRWTLLAGHLPWCACASDGGGCVPLQTRARRQMNQHLIFPRSLSRCRHVIYGVRFPHIGRPCFLTSLSLPHHTPYRWWWGCWSWVRCRYFPTFPHPTLQGVVRPCGGGGGTGDSTSNFVEAVAAAGDSTAKIVGAVATAGALPTSMHGRSLALSSLWITVTNARDAIHCFNKPYPVCTVVR